MNRVPASIVAIVATLGLSLTGCHREAHTTDEDATPQRVVCIAPAAAEMLEALGLLERVVGIGEFGPWPESLEGLPVAGGYSSPNVETVLALGADLLLTTGSDAALASHRELERLGIHVAALDTGTYDGVFAALAEVGELFDAGTEAEAVAERLRAELEATAAGTARLESRSVLFVVGRDPLYVAGPGSHVDEMIRMAGGTNVAHDALSPYQQVSIEAILERMPDVIIDTSDNRPDAPRGRLPGEWARWEFLPAVRDDRVFYVDPSRLVIPGMRLPEMTRLTARLVHPDVFGDPDVADLEAR